MATNRADTLDPALLRPGRLDRKIEFPLPSRREKRLIFQTITSGMNLSPDVDLEDCMLRKILHTLWPSHILLSGFTARPYIISRGRFNMSSCWSTRYFPFTIRSIELKTHLLCAAVRKNRYVILPVDFEEAWKVRDFVVQYLYPRLYFASTRSLSFQQTVKRSDATHAFCTSSFASFFYLLIILVSIQTDSGFLLCWICCIHALWVPYLMTMISI